MTQSSVGRPAPKGQPHRPQSAQAASAQSANPLSASTQFSALRLEQQQPTWLTLAAPRVPLEHVMQLPEATLLWAPAQTQLGPSDADDPADAPGVGVLSCVGLGMARDFRAQGPARFGAIREQLQDALSRLTLASAAGVEPMRPRAFGGFSFQCGRATDQHADEHWDDFGDARFVLPRFLYCHAQTGAVLCVALDGNQGDDTHLEHARRLLEQLPQLELPDVPPVSTPHGNAQRERMSYEAWSQLVQHVLQRIERQVAQKIVVARRTHLRFADPVSVPLTLAALCKQHPSSTRFAFHFGDFTFLGATPERLIHKRANQVCTEALAGTFRTEQADFASELLRSPKEHQEHQPVLEAIVERLQPYCHHIDYSNQPQLRELRHLLHLHTPITAELRTPCHVLELVEKLHPTPAVGGVPTEQAMDWIATNEPHARGWYAGPVGWVDAHGDGDFSVALRSGLIAGTNAYLYAGAGIVDGSVPRGEYDETELKLRALWGALQTEAPLAESAYGNRGKALPEQSQLG